MLLDNIDILKENPFVLTLMNSKGDELCIVNEAYDRTLEINSETTHKLSFTIPFKITDRSTNTPIKNDYYDLIQVGAIIKLNEEYKFLVIDADDNEGESDTKNVTCESLERLLANRFISLNNIDRQLYRNGNTVEVSDGIFEILQEEIPSWTMGSIDTSVQTEVISGNAITKYRYFDKFRKSVYSFLMTDVSNAYNLHIEYDTMNKQYKVFDHELYGVHTGLYISKENYIKSVKRKVIGENIVTRLHCSGLSGVDFTSFNKSGMDYIDDFSHYRNSGLMSIELGLALDGYDVFLVQKDIEFQALKVELDTFNDNLVVKQSELDLLNETIKSLKSIRGTFIASKDNENLGLATTNVNNQQTLINTKTSEIATLNTQITNKNSEITQIAIDIKKVNAKYVNTSTLIFNASLIEELDNFIREDDWSNENFSTAESLYVNALLIMEDYSQAPVEFEIEMVDFLQVVECQEDWDKLNIGDFVTVYISNLEKDYEMRIVSYNYSPDNNSLKVTFSNKNKKLEDIKSSGSLINKAVESGRDVNAKKIEWNLIKGNVDAVKQYTENEINMSKQNILSSAGYNRISLDENGGFFSDTRDPNKQLILTAGQLATTVDGLNTISSFVNTQGIYADFLMGRILMAENLYLENEGGNFSIDKNGFTLRDSLHKTLISPLGICNSDNIGFPDNIDSSHPFILDFYIDDNVNEVSQALLKISVQNFRAYETGASAGGATSETSSSGGGSTQTSSSGGASTQTSTDGGAFTQGQTSSTSSSGGEHSHIFASYSGGSASLPLNNYLAMSSSDFGGSSKTIALQADSIGDLYTEGISTQHSHSVSIPSVSIPNHSHSVSVPNHVHQTVIPSHTHLFTTKEHTHNLIYGVYEAPFSLGEMPIYVDGVLRTSTVDSKSLVDLTAFIVTKGWHQILIESQFLNRLTVSLTIKSYIGA